MIYAEPNYQLIHKDPTLLAEGDYLGVHYIVTSSIFCPTAYIEIPLNSILYALELTPRGLPRFYDTLYYQPVGGFTYYGHRDFSPLDQLPKSNPGSYYLGWDYGHIEDYNPSIGQGIKHSTAEIVRDCQLVIEAITDSLRIGQTPPLWLSEYHTQQALRQIGPRSILTIQELLAVGFAQVFLEADGKQHKLGTFSLNRSHPLGTKALRNIEVTITDLFEDSRGYTCVECTTDNPEPIIEALYEK